MKRLCGFLIDHDLELALLALVALCVLFGWMLAR